MNVPLAVFSAYLTNVLYNYFYREQTEVIFFNGYHPTCSNHLCIETTEKPLQNNKCSICNVEKIISWINEAKKTLDICMYTLSHQLLSETVIKAHKRGVCVRVIVDSDSIKTTWKMGNLGIAKKVKQKYFGVKLMHHKIIVIDNKKVILGSLNWTPMAVRNNWENTFITNAPNIVNSYCKEFEKLWIQFDN